MTRLTRVASDDLVLSRAIYRRLLATSANPREARANVRLWSPGVVLAEEGLPSFDETTLAGASLSNSSLLGHTTLLHVWATWCGPCKAELPEIARLYDTFQTRGLRVVGIAQERGADADPEVFRSWCGKNKVTWPQVLDPDSKVPGLSETLGVGAIPRLFLVDGEAHVVAVGPPVSQLVPELERLLVRQESASQVSGATKARVTGN